MTILKVGRNHGIKNHCLEPPQIFTSPQPQAVTLQIHREPLAPSQHVLCSKCLGNDTNAQGSSFNP